MADSTAIEWTDATWNPVTGCTKISAGCDRCYAERFAERFRGVKDHPFEQGFDLTLRPKRLSQPMAWRRPRMIFVNSMSDLFHKNVPARSSIRFSKPWRAPTGTCFRFSPSAALVYARMSTPATRTDLRRPIYGWGSRLRMAPSCRESGTLETRLRGCASCRWNPLSGRSINSISTASIGSSWAARAAQGRGQCIQIGSVKLGIIAWIAGSLFSSSNGAGFGRNQGGDCSTEKSGTSGRTFRLLRSLNGLAA